MTTLELKDLRDLKGLTARVRSRLPVSGLRSRVRALEAEVQENRQLNRRIAELTDVVAELLIPLEARDQDRVEEVLQRYRAGL